MRFDNENLVLPYIHNTDLMHELSIAYNVVKIATTAARAANARQVEAVQLQLGVLSGVVKDSLLFSYDIATGGTMLEGSRLEIEELPVVVYCPACKAEQVLPSFQNFRCPVCNGPTPELRQGRELDIISLEVIDEAPSA